MTAIMASLIENLIKFAFFVLVAFGGIMAGKKFRDKKDQKAHRADKEL